MRCHFLGPPTTILCMVRFPTVVYPFRFKVRLSHSYLVVAIIHAHSLLGNLIRAWGTNGRVNTTVENWDPHWECFVDNISIGALDLGEGVSNNRVLCEKTELNDGPHEFTINITSTSGVGTFWLDYIHYAPSATVSEETAYILVDNGDPAINYGSGWGALGSTANMTTVNGSEWTFDFTGMSYV
jgi:hypothetical protein